MSDQVDDFSLWAAELKPKEEPLTQAELAEVDKILGMMGRNVSIEGYAAGLFMRYNFNRWQMIINEVVRRMKESQGT